jgi:hypothetical protein
MERARQTEMTLFSERFQTRLARLRETGELLPNEYGDGVGSSECWKATAELQFHSSLMLLGSPQPLNSLLAARTGSKD